MSNRVSRLWFVAVFVAAGFSLGAVDVRAEAQRYDSDAAHTAIVFSIKPGATASEQSESAVPNEKRSSYATVPVIYRGDALNYPLPCLPSLP